MTIPCCLSGPRRGTGPWTGTVTQLGPAPARKDLRRQQRPTSGTKRPGRFGQPRSREATTEGIAAQQRKGNPPLLPWGCRGIAGHFFADFCPSGTRKRPGGTISADFSPSGTRKRPGGTISAQKYTFLRLITKEKPPATYRSTKKCGRFLPCSCPRRDSNPHIFKGQWILSPSRLPFRHSGKAVPEFRIPGGIAKVSKILLISNFQFLFKVITNQKQAPSKHFRIICRILEPSKPYYDLHKPTKQDLPGNNGAASAARNGRNTAGSLPAQ